MTSQNEFFDDYFNLKINDWLDKYQGRVPEQMTPQVFANLVAERGLELRMVDHVGRIQYSPDLSCCLIKDETRDTDRPYIVLCPDSMRGAMLEEGRAAILGDAILLKMETLFVFLRPQK